jgi:hypothetical protein
VSSRGYQSLRVRDDIDRDTQRHTDTQTQRHRDTATATAITEGRLIGKYDGRMVWHVGTERSGGVEWSGEERSGVKGKGRVLLALVCQCTVTYLGSGCPARWVLSARLGVL